MTKNQEAVSTRVECDEHHRSDCVECARVERQKYLERREKRRAYTRKWQRNRYVAQKAERVAQGLPPSKPGRPAEKYCFTPVEGGQMTERDKEGLARVFSPLMARMIVGILKHLRRLYPDEPEKWFDDISDPSGTCYRITFVENVPNVFNVEESNGFDTGSEIA